MAQMTHATTSNAESPFVCEVLDADEKYGEWIVDTGEPKKTRSGRITTHVRSGIVLYVRLVSGALPSPVALMDEATDRYTFGTARFAPGAFAPTPVDVITTSGNVYEMTLLGSFPPLCELPPAMRAMFHPTCYVGPEACPIILECVASLIDGFRPRNAQLIAHWPPATSTLTETAMGMPMHSTHLKRHVRRQRKQAAEAHAAQLTRYMREKMRRIFEVHRLIQDLGPDAAIDPLLAALNDELRDVRAAAAAQLSRIAQRLPVTPFLSAIQDRSWLNADVCYVAAHVFLAHIDEVPVAALLDLYAGGDAPWYTNVRITAIQAMARLGDQAPDEVVALLTDIAAHKSSVDIRVRWSVAKALGDLGARAPIEALLAGMRDGQPEVASAAARALLRHPGPLSEEALTEARLLSDLETARRVIYERVRERLNALDQRDDPFSPPHT